MKIVIKLDSGEELESLPTEIADVDRDHTTKQVVREILNGAPFTMRTAAGSVIIPAELLKTAIIYINW